MKELRTLISFVHKRNIFILKIIAGGIIILHFFWIFQAAGDGRFFLLAEDEVIYYGSAKVFAETNAVQAEGCIDENVSKIGHMNWYGPGYNVVYGTLFKVIGEKKAAFPWFHFALAMGMLLLIWYFPMAQELRLILIISLAVTQQFCVYIYTYFPETLVLFFATVLTFLIVRQYQAKDQKKKRLYLMVFIFCVVLFTLCRITFIFWLAALVGLAENRRSMIIALVIFVVGVILSLIYMKLFIAPAYASDMHKIDLLYAGKYWKFLVQSSKAFYTSLLAVFHDAPSVIKVLLGLVLASVIMFIFRKDKLIRASLLVSFTLLFVMFAYYTVSPFFLIKQTAMLVPLLLTGLIAGASSVPLAYGVMAVLLMVFPSPIRKTNEVIHTGRSAYEHYLNNIHFEKALAEIPHHIEGKPTVILWDYREYDYGYSTEALLPFSTLNKKPILYTTNIVDPSEASPVERFKLHYRLKVDYILSRHRLTWSNVTEVHATEFYHLYKLHDY